MPIPLYGFLHGDTVGLLMFAAADDTVESLAQQLQSGARVRVRPCPPDWIEVRYRGRVVDPKITVGRAGFEPLARFDVVCRRPE